MRIPISIRRWAVLSFMALIILVGCGSDRESDGVAAAFALAPLAGGMNFYLR